MIKIFITVRNRLAITKKCIEALRRHSTIPNQIYIFDNLTNYKIEEHFIYFSKLFKSNTIKQITFNSFDSTFGAFSKAVACNQFGYNHQQDPDKLSYDYLMILDNDMIVLPEWDITLLKAWQDIKEHRYKYIKIISQYPGGITNGKNFRKIAGNKTIIGSCGGSGFWSVMPNFFDDIGFLDVTTLIGCNKKHDQYYWPKLERAAKSKQYALGLEKELVIHCGGIAGSVCNLLANVVIDRLEKIKFKKQEEMIENMSFDDFFKKILRDKANKNDKNFFNSQESIGNN